MKCPPFLIAGLLPLVLAACGAAKPDDKAVEPPPTVSIAHVAERTLEGGFSASGRLVPREEVAVAPELPGYRVARVLVEEDALVGAGQTLAILDDALLRSQIAQARATLAQQQVAAERSREEAARVRGLDNQGVLSEEAIDQRRFAARSGEAAVAVARAQLNDLLVRQSRLVIRAPTSGRIVQRSVRPGDTSATGSTMFTLSRDDLIELHAEIPEASIGLVTVGTPAEVTLASGEKVAGTVRLRQARVDQQTGLVIVRIALPRDRDLRPGGFAQARFALAGAPAKVVPQAAVHFDADGASLKVLDRQDRAHRVAVRTGRRANGFVELLQGPPPGTRVILSGAAFILEGDKVRIARGTR